MMGETGPMGLHSKGRKTDMKTAAKRERKTLRIVELALLLGAAAFLMTGVWALNTQRVYFSMFARTEAYSGFSLRYS